MDTTRVVADPLGHYLGALEECLADPDATADAVAQRLFLSRRHADRLVGRDLGESAAALRRRVLLERAAYALLRSEAAVVDVATEAGYGSREGFSRAFADAFGASLGAWRQRIGSLASCELVAPNGIHFHPPVGLRIRHRGEVHEMDALDTLMRFHVEVVGEILDRLSGVDAAELDRTLAMDIEWCDGGPVTLRRLADGLVTQEERYAYAVQGRPRPAGDSTPEALQARHRVAGPALVEFVEDVLAAGRLADTFVMAEHTPPRSTTFGGAVLHVITFGALRRTMTLRALAAATGDDSLGWGDPVGLFDDVVA